MARNISIKINYKKGKQRNVMLLEIETLKSALKSKKGVNVYYSLLILLIIRCAS